MDLSKLISAILSIFGKKPAPDPIPVPSEPDPLPPAIPPHVDSKPETIPVPIPPVGKPITQPIITNPAQFIAAISAAAQECCRKKAVPASVTIAQAALESGWGKKCPGFNLFGIKADSSWTGRTTEFGTHEVIGGKTIAITDKFRAYDDWQGSIDDHADFLVKNPRYKPAFEFTDGPSFARAIAKAGYATDPDYADKLISIMHAHNLQMFD